MGAPKIKKDTFRVMRDIERRMRYGRVPHVSMAIDPQGNPICVAIDHEKAQKWCDERGFAVGEIRSFKVET